ncbi:RcnB family protein [Sphingomonas sp. Ag1]|jgi:Ni/Co efflux regulator RcnB|uniref:RcnB family protein n=1 Tax=Sphingomonas sp. Ag1 TaxID=1642949 RepID=UPI0006215533|nr:RcnB family protein [Sphingomonas sp. Ag1]KKI19298.1 membrane protein [Sphingomonas sp. Ag1]
MRKLIVSLMMAATIAPAVAAAQSPGELRRDRQDIREQRRDLYEAQRRGDRRDVREARQDLREARREYREDLRDRDRRWSRDDWRGYRNQNRALYARGQWRAPFRYNQWRPGARIAPSYYAQRYWINDPWRYRLPPARPNTRWVRHYNDVLLVDYRRGTVLDVIRNFYW